MITITDPRIEAYLMQLVPEPPPQISAIEEQARRSDFPIIGRLCGRLLHSLTMLKRPRLVVELGSGFGYSAYWFASALPKEGKVVLIDHSQQNIDQARVVFRETALLNRAEFRVGDALKIGAEYSTVDILFLDLDKYQYLDALKLMLPRLAPNALVIADNTLWYGRVAEEGTVDNDTEVIRQFNAFLFSRDDFFTSILPLRDGVLVAMKRG